MRVCAILALTTLVAACAGKPFETALTVSTAPRQPDGVLVEPPPVLPRGEDRGNASSSVVALRPPISDEQIASIVKSYVHALEDESHDEMFELFTSDVFSLAPVVAGSGTRAVNVREEYKNRFDQGSRGGPMSLRRYRGLEIAQLDKVERYEWSDLSKNGDPPRPTDMRDGDLYVRVPLVAPLGPNGDKLIHDVLLLVLRRDVDAKQVKVAGVAEIDTN
ncbi:hypothetical protein BH09MYX1_BH09MYX1_34980 [soil metagenome]